MRAASYRRTAKLESRWTVVDGLKLHAIASVNPVAGELPPVMLLSGLGISSRYMIPAALQLADATVVYAPDVPGVGQSEKPSRPFDVSQLADTLAAWMQAMNIERAVLVGHSFGSQIVVEFALRHPDKIERAVLAAPLEGLDGDSALRHFWHLLLDAPLEPLSLIPIAIRDYFTAGIIRAARTFRFALQNPLKDKLTRVHVPTLVVRGARDPIAQQRWAEEATRLLPRGEMAVIPKAAHAINYSSPSQFARLILRFIEGG